MSNEKFTTERQRHLYDLAEAYHAIVYYAHEFSAFADAGLKGWWRAYFATRAAPLGQVPAELVTATFFNFAHRMVAKALPSAWDIIPPHQLVDMRLDVASRALDRVFEGDPTPVDEAAELALHAVADLDMAGRPLYSAHCAHDAPGTARLDLWHVCTLLREYRFDGHNAALVWHDIDGCGCHVMMAASGRGNMETILPIRGFTEEEWMASVAKLRDRGWLDESGAFTPTGLAARDAVETATDQMSQAPLRALGPAGFDRLIELLEPLVERVRYLGPVPVGWPPAHLRRG